MGVMCICRVPRSRFWNARQDTVHLENQTPPARDAQQTELVRKLVSSTRNGQFIHPKFIVKNCKYVSDDIADIDEV